MLTLLPDRAFTHKALLPLVDLNPQSTVQKLTIILAAITVKRMTAVY